MMVRSASLLATALASLAVPAQAQDDPPPLPELTSEDAADVIEAEPVPLEAGAGWQGQWQGEWAEDGTYHGTWSGTYSDPGPTAARAIHPGGVPNAGYTAADRTAWLAQCRNAYYPQNAATGGASSPQADVCESYLQQYERSYALAAQAPTYAPGAPLPAVPGGYAYGYPGAPVMWVRVPIVRQPAAAGE